MFEMSKFLYHTNIENGVTFNYYRAKVNFTTAKSACEKSGSDLASILDKPSKERIESYLDSQDGESYWWIGLRRTPQGWQWLNGETLQPSVMDFTDDTGRKKCASLFKPSVGKRVYLYDYGCEEQNMYYICETRDLNDNSQYPNQSPTTLGIGSIIAIILGIILVILLLMFFLLRHRRGRTNMGNSQEYLKQQDTEVFRGNATHIGHQKHQEGDYATINDDPGYATIDTVIYSEVVNENQQLEKDQRDDAQGSTQPTYAKVNKERKSSHAKIFETEVADKNHGATNENQDISEQYAKVMKKR